MRFFCSHNCPPVPLFTEVNYEYRDKENKARPFYDFLITRLLFVPLLLTSLYFFLRNIAFFAQQTVSAPFWFESILLSLTLIIILSFYPNQKLTIDSETITLIQNQKNVYKISIKNLEEFTITVPQKTYSFLSYKTIRFVDVFGNSFEFTTPKTQVIEKILFQLKGVAHD